MDGQNGIAVNWPRANEWMGHVEGGEAKDASSMDSQNELWDFNPDSTCRTNALTGR